MELWEVPFEPVALVQLTGLRDHVDTARVALPGTELIPVGRLPACVVFVLLHRELPPDAPPPVVRDNSTVMFLPRWLPEFWRKERDVVGKALSLVLEGIEDPAIWAMGEYSPEDFDELAKRGLLPEGMSPAPGFYGTLMLRVRSQSELLLPAEQGAHHTSGARLAVFPQSQHPHDLYQAWLAAVREGKQHWPFRELLLSQEYAPESAVAWISPLGYEDRRQVTIAKQGLSASTFAEAAGGRPQSPAGHRAMRHG